MTVIHSIKMTLKILFVTGFLSMFFMDLYAENLSKKEYIIGPDDVLNIQVWDNEDLHRNVEVSQEGLITFPLIGQIHADGLSVFELENLIKEKLANGYIVDPHINVSVIEYKSQKVFVLGEVKKPGSYALKRKIHLLELISEAGGFTDKAGRIITIVRPKSLKHARGPLSHTGAEKNEIITLDLGELKADSSYDNFFVESNDSIYVNTAPRIFISGQVEKPGEFEWERGLTVRQAISIAGGPTQMAALNRTEIIRIMDNGKEAKLKASMDDLVRANDIIRVPERYF